MIILLISFSLVFSVIAVAIVVVVKQILSFPSNSFQLLEKLFFFFLEKKEKKCTRKDLLL